jgi:hypothetical protein
MRASIAPRRFACLSSVVGNGSECPGSAYACEVGSANSKGAGTGVY